MIKAVLFDLDETLLDDERTALEAQALACQWAVEQRPGIDPQRLQAAFHASSIGYWKTYDQASEKRTGEELRLQFWREGLGACNVDDPDFVDALSDTYNRMRARTFALFPDTVPCLDALKGRFRMGVVGNGAVALQTPKIDVLGLRRWMDFVIFAEAVGVSKPDPAIFRLALDEADCAANEAVMVGDLLERDIQGALNAGITPIWINREGADLPAGAPRPAYTIRTLAELPPLLHRLNAA